MKILIIRKYVVISDTKLSSIVSLSSHAYASLDDAMHDIDSSLSAASMCWSFVADNLITHLYVLVLSQAVRVASHRRARCRRRRRRYCRRVAADDDGEEEEERHHQQQQRQ